MSSDQVLHQELQHSNVYLLASASPVDSLRKQLQSALTSSMSNGYC